MNKVLEEFSKIGIIPVIALDHVRGCRISGKGFM